MPRNCVGAGVEIDKLVVEFIECLLAEVFVRVPVCDVVLHGQGPVVAREREDRRVSGLRHVS